MERSISIAEFIAAIKPLPEGPRRRDPRVWYMSQKEHWLGWLHDYDGPGAYNRKTDVTRDAKFAYNHVVCPELLLWLIEAAGAEPEIVQAAHEAAAAQNSLPAEAGAIRRCVPWSMIYALLFANKPVSASETRWTLRGHRIWPLRKSSR